MRRKVTKTLPTTSSKEKQQNEKRKSSAKRLDSRTSKYHGGGKNAQEKTMVDQLKPFHRGESQERLGQGRAGQPM